MEKTVFELFNMLVKQASSAVNEPDDISSGIKSNFLLLRLARELDIDLPLLKVGDSCGDLFHRFVTANKDWKECGLYDLCPENIIEAANFDFSFYVDSEVWDIFENAGCDLSLGTFSCAALFSYNCEQEWKDIVQKALDEYEVCDDKEEGYQIIGESVLEGVTCALHQKFIKGEDYPDNPYGELTEAVIEYIKDDILGDFMALSNETLESLAFELLVGVNHMNEDQDLNCLFYMHPKENLGIVGDELLEDMRKNMLLDEGVEEYMDNVMVVYDFEDAFVFGISYNPNKNSPTVAVATYLFMNLISAYIKEDEKAGQLKQSA